MSSRPAWFLGVRVRVREAKHRFRLRLPCIALYPLHLTILAWDGVFGFLPGRAGQKARAAKDSLHTLLLAMTNAGPNDYVDIEVSRFDDTYVRVRVHTF